jgi:hypothetical protein
MSETEEKPEFVQDLESLDDALGAIREDGHDADIESVGPAIAVLDGLIQTGKDVVEREGDAGNEIAVEELISIRDAIESVAAGDGDDEDLETAEEGLSLVGQQMQLVLVEQALANA